MIKVKFHKKSGNREYGAGSETFRSTSIPIAVFAGVLSFLVLGCFGVVHAESEPFSTQFSIDIDDGKGADLRPRVDLINDLVLSEQVDEAERKAIALRSAYEAQFDPALTQYTFQSAAEFEEFRTSPIANFEWIDWGYKLCLQNLVFIAVERGEFPKALAMLAKLEAIAPISSGTAVEIGYVLNQIGKPDQALKEYHRARDLALRYASQKPYLAPSLRGISFALIELDRLEEAEEVLEQSLIIDPGNRVAPNELNYIRDLRGSRKKVRASH